MYFHSYNEYNIQVQYNYNELWEGGLVSGKNTYNETPLYFELKKAE